MRPLLLFVCVALGMEAHAEVVIANPGFADSERFQYIETIGSLSRPFDVALTKATDAPAHWEFHSVGADLESIYRLDPNTLLSLSSESLTKASDATVHRSAEYRDLKVKAGPDELVVTDMGSLPAVLRGFPWGKLTYAKLLYIGNTSYGGTAVSFELQVLGRESVTTAGRTWDCWHATTGLSGALGLLLPKTDWWFAVERTHFLVKTTGPTGGPGSPMRTLLLKSASGS